MKKNKSSSQDKAQALPGFEQEESPGFARFKTLKTAQGASGFTLAASYRNSTETFTTRSLIEALEVLCNCVTAYNQATKAVRGELPHATQEELNCIAAEMAARQK